VRDGVRKERSKWLHDVTFPVRVADRNHPVTRGIADFEIHDETYILFDVHAGVTVLLTTDAPTSQPTLAWAKTYEAARVVYLQLGHDHLAYENPSIAGAGQRHPLDRAARVRYLKVIACEIAVREICELTARSPSVLDSSFCRKGCMTRRRWGVMRSSGAWTPCPEGSMTRC